MDSIVRYKERGKWGNPLYRGNCSGKIIKDVIQQFYPNSLPKQFIEVFSGGGTGKEVALSLGITDSIHLDLNNGWNALKDKIPVGADFIFSHPPYWNIIKYGIQRNSYDADDLSNDMDYSEFIQKLDLVNQKIYNSLTNGGRHAFLVGDVRKKGKYYSIIKDMTWFGELESHIIKQQFNCLSDKKTYKSQNFIPIIHEHLLIFKKNNIWQVAIKYTKDFIKDLRELTNVTWRDLLQATLENLGGTSDLQTIYQTLEGAKKASNNKYWKEKIRQTLQINPNFQSIDKGIWKLII
ncbi:hypothetical protein COL77_30615 [Bacillus wiedmannii]|uniref:hypothetical protein n=1 Tax=Bacillus wiedmannii TaxID=1890302 RepID=UPI000BF96EB4|nr:hypothetical protein [Bacillus wiedmannii]PFZ33873.1 hypothetical protein COL77_30615 [Bacillus wiedmannii]